MAVNKDPWVGSLFREVSLPLIIMGKVQAGATATIKRGEICSYNETAGYFIPVNAAGDYIYSLAIANEEQKADSLERYMEFQGIREGDVYEFALSAARSVAYGDCLEISDSQTLAYDADGNGVAFSVGRDNYPTVGTSIRSQAYAHVCFHPEFSYIYKNMIPRNLKKIIDTSVDLTLKLEDCGALVIVKAAKTVTAPNAVVPIGWWFDLVVGADQNVDFDPKPDTAGVYIKGALQSAGKYIRMADIGDYARFVWDGTNWIASYSISGADGDITVEG